MEWISKVADLVGGLIANGIETMTASAERRAELKAERNALFASYEAWWDGFEARAVDRVKDAMSDADAKPSREDTDPGTPSAKAKAETP